MVCGMKRAFGVNILGVLGGIYCILYIYIWWVSGVGDTWARIVGPSSFVLKTREIWRVSGGLGHNVLGVLGVHILYV